jgi:ribosome-binding protein aMBF1 (putative translation factor)
MGTRARKLGKSVHSGDQSAFCELMVKARKTAGLTQRELADRLHKPQSFVSKYEGVNVVLTSWNFWSFAKLLEWTQQSS